MRSTLSLLIALLLFVTPQPLSANDQGQGSSAPDLTSVFDQALSLQERTSRGETVRVIVQLRVPVVPEGLISSMAATSQRTRIADVRERVLGKLKTKPKFKAEKVRKFKTVPAFAAEVDRDALTALSEDADVASISEDFLLPPSLSGSIPVIDADLAWGTGVQGSGMAVAVLDTGANKSHPMLSGKVVSEACYGTTSGSASSLCPGGASSSTASGSGSDCSTSISGCGHGTHVAAIAAGDDGSLFGVARSADIIAVKIFSQVSSQSSCGSSPAPCALAYTSDIIEGLERVYALKDSYDIASVNMSLGGGYYTSSCDGASPSLKQAIDNLASAGIATLVASGNNGYTNGISFPACISSAISVGATTKADAVAGYSNSASLLDLLAPGSSINAASSSGGYTIKSGTSMATPHVAGAWALVKEANPAATVSDILTSFKNSGANILDSRNGITKARINVADAILSFGRGTLSVTLSPAGAVSDGAKWRVDGGVWQDSGATVTDLHVGTHQVEFKAVPNSTQGYLWTRPQAISLSIDSDGQNVYSSGTYVAREYSYISNDLDGDGKSDILWRDSSGNAALWIMDGITKSSGHLLGKVSTSWKIKDTGDFDGDGKVDILWRDSSGNVALWLMDGATKLSGNLLGKVSTSWKIQAAADFDGDGKADILWRDTSGNAALWLMDGATKLSGNLLGKVSTSWKIQTAADCDGDAKADILWRDTSGNTALWLMDGATKRSGTQLGKVGTSWKIMGAGDYDSDGNADVLWRNTDGSVSIWLMDGVTRRDESGLVDSTSSSWSIKK